LLVVARSRISGAVAPEVSGIWERWRGITRT
jgi:hypothetical protein